MALQTRPSPSWNASPDICIIFGFLHNPPPPSPDIFTIHLHRLRISLQSTSIFLECLPGHMHHLGCLRNPLHHLWISSRPSLPYISRPISGHRHQHCMAQNPAMRSCNSPGSGYPSTDTCGYGSACRYPHFGGTWQQGYRHTYLYWHIDCQVNCTKDHDERPAWMKYTSSPAGMHLD